VLLDGNARFAHKSIMEYFSARALYELVKKYTKPLHSDDIAQGTDYGRTFINEKIIKGSGVTDSESDVLNFVLDMITYNNCKSTEMKGDDNEGSVNALESLKTIVSLLSKKCIKTE